MQNDVTKNLDGRRLLEGMAFPMGFTYMVVNMVAEAREKYGDDIVAETIDNFNRRNPDGIHIWK